MKQVRVRAALSAPELAGWLEVSSAEITPWEGGDPPSGVVQHAVEACSISLCSVLTEPDPDPHD